MRRVVPVVVGVLLAISVLPLLPATPAGAAPDVPVLTAPTPGLNVGAANPVFTWNPTPGAVRYTIRIGTDPDVVNLVPGGSVNTTNTSFTLTTDLPNATLYWRVQAFDIANVMSQSPSGRSFTKGAVAAPSNLKPTGTPANFNFPTQPPTFSWDPVPGAIGYEVTFDNDSLFTPPFTVPVKTTVNTSFTLDTPLTVGQTFFWKVRAKGNNGLFSTDSATGQFRFQWSSVPTRVYPPNTNNPAIEEVVFEWTPTPGAVRYELQYTPNADFSNPISVEVKSTRYSPPVTLNNGAYFWKVRGITGFGGTGPLSDIFTFTRAWPGGTPANQTVANLDKIELLSPANDDFNVVEPNFSWTAQRLASRYQLELSTDVNFSPLLTSTCVTTHTQLTPKDGCGVNPAPGTTYYWRVRGLDDPLPVNGAASPSRRFIYRPPVVAMTSPANGTSTYAPILTWDPSTSPLIGRYRVLVYNEKDVLVKQVDTYNTSYAPDNLSILADENLHTWKVVTIDSAGRVGTIGATSRSFEMIAPPPGDLVPSPQQITPNGATGTRVPTLRWAPVTGAVQYTVRYSLHNANAYSDLVTNHRSTAYAHLAANILPGTYDWYVIAKNAGGGVISESAVDHDFTVVPLDASVPGPAWPACSLVEPCIDRFDTPTLDWEPVIGATHFMVYIAVDPIFSNLVSGTPYTTPYSQLTPQISLPDNQAGEAYYWYARPCYGLICGPEPASFAGGSPIRAFQKSTKAIPIVSPANGSSVTNDVTFVWGGFLQTNCNAPLAPGARCGDTTDPNEVTQEARTYKVEVSDKADYSSILDSVTVDQTTYTAFNKTYPEGPLYWRVAPIDGSGNILTWTLGNFTKKSPVTPLLLPGNEASPSKVPTFSWTPQAFDAAYEVEVYKNPGVALAAGNRVFAKTTDVAAATPTEVLPAGTYGWRVRRLDDNDRPGPWSNPELPSPGPVGNINNLRLFTLGGDDFVLLDPANGETVPDPNRLLFEWEVAEGAAKYKFEVNTQQNFQGTKPEADVTTVTTNWAPRAAYAMGKLWWRVSSLDAGGNVIKVAAPFSFNSGSPGSRYVSIPPVRVLDSRNGTGWSGRLQSTAPRTLKVAGGAQPAPIDATAVVLNVTAVESNAPSFISVYPTGSLRPSAGSNLNFSANQVIPNLVTVKVGTNGSVDFFTSDGNVDVVADMVGFYDLDNGDKFTAIDPARLLDSRTSNGNWPGPLGQVARDLQVTGRGGVPDDATAAIVNITVTDGNAQSFLMAYPSGSPQPEQASNLNFLPGQVIPNLAIVKLGNGGKIRFFNAIGTVNVIVDVVGFFKPGTGDLFHALEPNRVLDTRINNGLNGKFVANQIRPLQVTGRGGIDVDRNVPSGATGVVMNTTAVSGSSASYLTLFPDGTTRPAQASNLNFSKDQIIPNLVTVKLSALGRVSIYNNLGQVDVLADVVGYYSAF